MRKSVYTICAVSAAALMLNLTACGGSGQGETAAGTTAAEVTESAAETTTAAEESQASPDLAEILEAVQDAYGEDYLPNTAIDATVLEQTYGIDAGLYEEFVGEMPMISTFVETFIGVKAKEGKGDDVEKALTEYRERLVGDTMQYPMNVSKIQASQVVRHGDYVFFVMLGGPDDAAMEQGDEAALKSAEENNKIAIDVIDGFFK